MEPSAKRQRCESSASRSPSFIEDWLQDKATCPICLDLMVHIVVESKCGHLFCGECVAKQRRSVRSVTHHCAVCRTASPWYEDQELPTGWHRSRSRERDFHQIPRQRDFDVIPRACPNPGCTVRLPLHELETHKRQCTHKVIAKGYPSMEVLRTRNVRVTCPDNYVEGAPLYVQIPGVTEPTLIEHIFRSLQPGSVYITDISAEDAVRAYRYAWEQEQQSKK